MSRVLRGKAPAAGDPHVGQVGPLIEHHVLAGNDPAPAGVAGQVLARQHAQVQVVQRVVDQAAHHLGRIDRVGPHRVRAALVGEHAPELEEHVAIAGHRRQPQHAADVVRRGVFLLRAVVGIEDAQVQAAEVQGRGVLDLTGRQLAPPVGQLGQRLQAHGHAGEAYARQTHGLRSRSPARRPRRPAAWEPGLSWLRPPIAAIARCSTPGHRGRSATIAGSRFCPHRPSRVLRMLLLRGSRPARRRRVAAEIDLPADRLSWLRNEAVKRGSVVTAVSSLRKVQIVGIGAILSPSDASSSLKAGLQPVGVTL